MTQTVTIVCTHPHGLRLEVPGMTSVTLRGPAALNRGGINRHGGAAFTEVPAAFWTRWYAAHRNDPAVLSHSVYVAGELHDAPRPAA